MSRSTTGARHARKSQDWRANCVGQPTSRIGVWDPRASVMKDGKPVCRIVKPGVATVRTTSTQSERSMMESARSYFGQSASMKVGGES